VGSIFVREPREAGEAAGEASVLIWIGTWTGRGAQLYSCH
jgi:hypothetical protein